MDAYGTNIVQGSVTIRMQKIHGGMLNCLVVNDVHPEEWFFKQFPNEEMVYEYAIENNLSVRKENDD